MAARLSDSELANRTREANRRRGERHRQRLASAGKSALTVWIPDTLRTALTAAAAANGATIADTAAALLTAALDPTTRPVDNFPLDAPAGVDPVGDDRRARILALKRKQPELSNYAIAEQVGCSEPTVRRALKAIRLEAPP